jgi:DNA uptake protein ComE-like DNA-binding protein
MAQRTRSVVNKIELSNDCSVEAWSTKPPYSSEIKESKANNVLKESTKFFAKTTKKLGPPKRLLTEIIVEEKDVSKSNKRHIEEIEPESSINIQEEKIANISSSSLMALTLKEVENIVNDELLELFNSNSIKRLLDVRGIGKKRAQSIIDYKQSNGSYIDVNY